MFLATIIWYKILLNLSNKNVFFQPSTFLFLSTVWPNSHKQWLWFISKINWNPPPYFQTSILSSSPSKKKVYCFLFDCLFCAEFDWTLLTRNTSLSFEKKWWWKIIDAVWINKACHSSQRNFYREKKKKKETITFQRGKWM